MEELSFDNILDQNEIESLFGVDEEESPNDETQDKEKDSKKATEDVDVDSLFTTEDPEGVGSEEDNQEKEDTSSNKAEDSSPKTNNFFSSIAEALKEEGILPDLDDDVKIESPEDFAEAMRSQVSKMLDETQQRILRALDAGIEDSEIRNYEKILNYVGSISEDDIKDESENGEKLRQNLIYQDFINRGYSKERAQREVKKSFDGGTDVEDALEALSSNAEYFKEKYTEAIEEAEEEKRKAIEERNKEAEKLKKDFMENDTFFGDIKLDKSTRQKAFDSISKPVYKDPKTGRVLTAVQKYQMENSTEFMKNVGLLFTLTDGFKNLNSIIQGKVKKEVKKGIKNLETTLNGSSRNSDGSLRFSSGVSDDQSSFSTFEIDV